jgi:hypothetical protein
VGPDEPDGWFKGLSSFSVSTVESVSESDSRRVVSAAEAAVVPPPPTVELAGVVTLELTEYRHTFSEGHKRLWSWELVTAGLLFFLPPEAVDLLPLWGLVLFLLDAILAGLTAGCFVRVRLKEDSYSSRYWELRVQIGRVCDLNENHDVGSAGYWATLGTSETFHLFF